MIIHYLSASRLKKYLQCSESYYQTYENGIRSDAEHLRFGTLMHRVFERWFQETNKTMKDIFDDEWVRADIVSPEYHKDALDIMALFEATNDRDAINLGYEYPFAIDILNGEVFDTSSVDWSNSLAVRAFLKELEEKETPIIFGFIDRLEYDPINDELKIIDYKTSRVPLTQQEANSDEQMSMYALVAQYVFPEYKKVSLNLHYVRYGTIVTTTREPYDNERFKDWLVLMFYKIKDDNAPVATLNRYCGWCDARHGCQAYKDLMESGYDVDVESLNFEEMDTELENIKVFIKLLDGRKKEIEGIMKDALKQSDNTPLKAGSAERFLTPNLRMDYDPATLLNVMGEDAWKYLSVNKGEVDKAIKGNDELIQALAETGRTYYIAPTLRRKAKK